MSPDSSPENQKIKKTKAHTKKKQYILNQISAGDLTTFPGGVLFLPRHLIEHVRELSSSVVWEPHTWDCWAKPAPGNTDIENGLEDRGEGEG